MRCRNACSTRIQMSRTSPFLQARVGAYSVIGQVGRDIIIHSASELLKIASFFTHLTRTMIAEQRVPVDVKQVALIGVRQPRGDPRHVLRGVQAQQLVQPRLHVVTWRVPDMNRGTGSHILLTDMISWCSTQQGMQTCSPNCWRPCRSCAIAYTGTRPTLLISSRRRPGHSPDGLL